MLIRKTLKNNMSKSFITLDEAVGLIQEISDDEDESALIILPPDTRGEMTNEEEDEEDLNECLELKEVAGNVEVFHPSLDDTHAEELPCTSQKQSVKRKKKLPGKRTEKSLNRRLNQRQLARKKPTQNYSNSLLFRCFGYILMKM